MPATPLYHLTAADRTGRDRSPSRTSTTPARSSARYTDAGFRPPRRAVGRDRAGTSSRCRRRRRGRRHRARDQQQRPDRRHVRRFRVADVGLLWNASDARTRTRCSTTIPARGVSPHDINDDGVVVGGFGVPSRAFVWTAADGLVDYGIQDPNVEDQQARWTAINAAGKIDRLLERSTSRTSTRRSARSARRPCSAWAARATMLRTNAVGMNDAGVAVGLGLSESVADPRAGRVRRRRHLHRDRRRDARPGQRQRDRDQRRRRHRRHRRHRHRERSGAGPEGVGVSRRRRVRSVHRRRRHGRFHALRQRGRDQRGRRHRRHRPRRRRQRRELRADADPGRRGVRERIRSAGHRLQPDVLRRFRRRRDAPSGSTGKSGTRRRARP